MLRSHVTFFSVTGSVHHTYYPFWLSAGFRQLRLLEDTVSYGGSAGLYFDRHVR